MILQRLIFEIPLLTINMEVFLLNSIKFFIFLKNFANCIKTKEICDHKYMKTYSYN